jgi:hypothetical protein
MIKVSLPHNKFEEYCKYKFAAYEQFFDKANRYCKKKSFYKNGDKHYWFYNKDYKVIGPLVDALRFESIVVETKKVK